MNPLRFILAVITCGWLTAFLPAYSQSKFTKVLYDLNGYMHAYAMTWTEDDKFILAGNRDFKPMVMKIDQEGIVEWQNTYDTVQGMFFCAARTSDGNFVIAGCDGLFNPGSGGDAILLKINSSGDTLWSKKFDMGYSEIPYCIKPTSDGGFVLCGRCDLQTSPYNKQFTARFSASGSLVWAKTYSKDEFVNSAYSATETPDGGFIIAGRVPGVTKYNLDLSLIKTSVSGDVVWAKKFPDMSNQGTTAYDIAITNDGFVCLFVDQIYRMNLMKLDFSGNVIWNKRSNAQGYFLYNYPGPKLHRTLDGGYYCVNGSDSPFGPYGSFLKTDSTGEAVWVKDLFILSNDVFETSDGGFLVSGNGPIMGVALASTDNDQIGLIKLNQAGVASDCVNWQTPSTESVTPVLQPLNLSTETSGSLSPLHLWAVPHSVATDTGCVAYTGGIAENAGMETLTLKPNPTPGPVTLSSDILENAVFTALEVYDLFGKRISVSGLSGNSCDLGQLPEGLYMLKAFSGNHTFAGKLLIMR